VSLIESMSPASEYHYVGGELELFQHAVNWKAYFRSRIRPWLAGRVLEVGAGLGGTTRLLCDGRQEAWTALEPSRELLRQFQEWLEAQPLPLPIELVQGTTVDLQGQRRFDTLLYIDVLEHLSADAEEVERATELLEPGGHLVVLSPAHPWLFTPFDQAIGHFRRYTARSLRALTPAGLELRRLFYLDAVGLLASLGNRLLLRQQMPTLRQIHVWDRCLVPLSRWVDPLLGYCLGKSIVGVWRKR
jgi:SAM-dependent methyltransferase